MIRCVIVFKRARPGCDYAAKYQQLSDVMRKATRSTCMKRCLGRASGIRGRRRRVAVLRPIGLPCFAQFHIWAAPHYRTFHTRYDSLAGLR